MRGLFWNEETRRIRALWRLLLQAALMIGLCLLPIFLVAEPLTALHRRGLFLATLDKESYDRVINILVGPLMSAMVVASVWAAGRWLDRRAFADFGLRFGRRWWLDLSFGLCLGALLMGAVFVSELRAGWVVVTGSLRTTVPGLSLGLAIAFSVTKDLCVGFYEEMVARGYQLRNLVEGLVGAGGMSRGVGIAGSVLVSSAVFGGLHAFNENSTIRSTLNVAFIGIMFAVAALATGELALPIGLHVSWNFFQGTIFGLAVSGAKEGASLIAVRQVGPALWSGGDFGPEAGLVGTAAALLGIILILAWARFRGRAGGATDLSPR